MILVLAELHEGKMSVATLKAISAAKQLGGDMRVVSVSGLAEAAAPAVVSEAKRVTATHVIAAATSYGKDVLPRIAALLDAPMVSEVTEIHATHEFTHPIYAGNALERVKVSAPCVVLSVRPTAFAAATEVAAEVLQPAENTLSTHLSYEGVKSARPELSAARVVVSGGRGVGAAGFKKLETLADKLGAALGASRAAVDAGYAPNDWQVGQTGKVVAPELYIAIGISGAIQHVAGMKDSKIIVAINRDENAPLFEVADFSLVADWEATVDALTQTL